MKDGMVFEGSGNDVPFTLACADCCRGTDRLVIGFGTAGCEGDLTRLASEDLRDVRTCLIEGIC